MQQFHGVCDKCGSKTYGGNVELSPGDWMAIYKCPNCDTGLKFFAKSCLASLLLMALAGLGVSLLGFLFQPVGELGLIDVLVGLLGLVIVGLIIKAMRS